MKIRLLGLDPGLRSGFALFEYSNDSPAALLDSGEVPNGVEGFIDWWPKFTEDGWKVDELVVEKFIIDGTITGTWAPQIEGAIKVLWDGPATWHTRSDKAALQRSEPARRGWFKASGIDLRGSHALDAATHCMVLLKRRQHLPTLKAYWPQA